MYLFLVDLRSVEGRERYLNRLLPGLRQAGLVRQLKEVESPTATVHLITEVVRQGDYQTVVAIGDDAFLASVAGAALGSSLAIGYIPLGERTRFADSVGIKAEGEDIASRLSSRRLRTFDLLRINRFYAVDSVHLGALVPYFETQARTESAWQRWRRTWGYRLRSLWQEPPVYQVRVEWRDFVVETSFVHGMILNGGRLSGQDLKPQGVVADDGMANVFLISRLSTRERLSGKLSFVATGAAGPLPHTHLRARELVMGFDQAPPLCLDGHVVPLGNQLQYRLIADAFRLIV